MSKIKLSVDNSEINQRDSKAPRSKEPYVRHRLDIVFKHLILLASKLRSNPQHTSSAKPQKKIRDTSLHIADPKAPRRWTEIKSKA